MIDNTLTLIEQATAGDTDATDRILTIIQRHHMDREVRRYRGRNVLVDDDDIESSFLWGCYRGIQRNRGLGNPLIYVLWQGRLQVLSLFRSKLSNGVNMLCNDCGRVAGVRVRAGAPVCTCGSRDVSTWMHEEAEDYLSASGQETIKKGEQGRGLDRLEVERELWFSRATYRVQIEEMRGRLTGRVLELFDLMVIEGINGQTTRNYLRTIAELWGVSAPTVAVYLRKLREEIVAYYEAS